MYCNHKNINQKITLADKCEIPYKVLFKND